MCVGVLTSGWVSLKSWTDGGWLTVLDGKRVRFLLDSLPSRVPELVRKVDVANKPLIIEFRVSVYLVALV